ncbi:MFS transporter [Cellulomonas hominis]|uniref:MFS transporter n=1 Tax=Cellulomonas hominis TaxID=156981 RepID=UPI0020BD541A|nr:MFS transporter [Cellulomonas hominis]
MTGPRRPSARTGRGAASPHLPVDPAVARARWLLMGLFALSGLMLSGWLARLPAVRDALDLGTAELGGLLIAGSIGSLATVSVAGALVNRYGGRFVLYVSMVAFAAAYVLIGIGPTTGSVPVLTAGIFLSGVGFAIGNVPLNVETAAVERRMGRTVLPQFHAAFSIGSVLGSGIGALCAVAGVPLLAQFVATAVVGTVWRLLSVPGAVIESLPPERAAVRATQEARAEGRSPREAGLAGRLRAARVRRVARPGSALGAWREPRTLLIGVVIMSAALSEGAANDWLALAVVDGFDQVEAVGAAMFGVFVGAMTAVRLLGTRLIDRYGRVVVLRTSGVVSFAGLVLFGFAPSLPLAAVGIVAWGFGAALTVPLGIAAASDDPLRAASRVAVVSAFSSTASLAAPPLLGLAAELMGTRHALLLITVAMIASVLLARSVRRPDVADVAAGTGHAPVDDPGAPVVATAEPAAVPVLDVPVADEGTGCVPSGSVRREPAGDPVPEPVHPA